MAKAIPVLDLMFFLTETKSNPKHVAALMLFKLPDDAGKRFVADLATAYRKGTPVAPFNQVAEFSLLQMPRWVEADTLDMKYHVRHTALPAGATHDDFLELVAELHTQILDRSRPCFRAYFIEGLPERQFALFLKIHHAMVDGASAIARISASLDERPDARDLRPLYTVALDNGSPAASTARSAALAALKGIALKQTLALKDLYGSLLRKGIGRGSPGAGSVPFTAPRGPMNAPVQAGRAVATLSLPIGEMKAVGKAFGGTLNDVAVTVVDAALTRYLEDRGHALAEPLVAMCPVSLREPGDKEAATKASALYVPLGRPKATIGQRMDEVVRAITSAKAELSGMSKDAAMLYAIFSFGLSELADTLGADAVTRPLANFVLSNVPGPRTDLYLGGARMQAIFPISALGGGIGLNVTLLSYAGSMDFGFVANGASMPDLDHLARCTHDAFEALRRAAARRAATAKKKDAPTPRPAPALAPKRRRPAASAR